MIFLNEMTRRWKMKISKAGKTQFLQVVIFFLLGEKETNHQKHHPPLLSLSFKPEEAFLSRKQRYRGARHLAQSVPFHGTS